MNDSVTTKSHFTITDAILWRSNEITELLAGCLAMKTVYTLKQLERIHDSALTDIKAKAFIFGMRERFSELQAAEEIHDEERMVEIIMEVAKDKKVIFDYAYWICLPRNVKADVLGAIKELQGLQICLHTINNLQGWISNCEDWYERHGL